MKDERNWENRICPYLGQRSDPETALSYPSGLNCCTHTKTAASIPLGHQEEYCLTTRHPTCERYTAEPGAPLPADLPATSRRRRLHKKRNHNWLWGILLLGLGVLAAWLLLTRGGDISLNPREPTATSEYSKTSTPVSATEIPSTATSSPTAMLTDTPTVRPLLELDTPLGIDAQFVIHQIQEGDSLDRIAANHGTTVAALMACNYRLPSPLLAGWAIVVPLNFVDVMGYPTFEVYGVTEEISLEDLAARLSVDLTQFKYYNALSDNFVPETGDWFLVPRSRELTPTP